MASPLLAAVLRRDTAALHQLLRSPAAPLRAASTLTLRQHVGHVRPDGTAHAEATSSYVAYAPGPGGRFTQLAGAAGGGASIRAAGEPPPALGVRAAELGRKLTSYLLPAGYPSTVAPAYARYAGWSFVAMAFSSAGGVLSMQSLLYAVGVGAGSVPLAAALNWVIKDGLGQLGGVLYAALVNTRFDSDPKRWRLVSALASDAATALEVCTPLFPGAFLPMAAVANIGKNVAWLSASATKAGLHQALAVGGNLADVTGKAGSQTIAASTLGTLLGVALSPLVGSDSLTLLAAFSLVSACHLSCVTLSLRALPLPTLNPSRLALAVLPALDVLLEDPAGARGGGEAAAAAAAAAADAAVLCPRDVNPHDPFLPFLPLPHPMVTAPRPAWMTAAATGAGSASSPLPDVHVISGAPLSDFPADAAGGVDAVVDSLRTRRYAVGLSPTTPSAPGSPGLSPPPPPPPPLQVHVVYASDAGWRHVLAGHLHALAVGRLAQAEAAAAGVAAPLAPEAHARILAAAAGVADAHASGLIGALERHGWWVGTPQLEDQGHPRRVSVAGGTATGTPPPPPLSAAPAAA
jgi:hypothetical protein